MAILKGGPNGPFSGKVGSVIGSNWRDVNYIRGLPRVKHHKASPAQIIQRERFPSITTFLYQVEDALDKGWDKQKKMKGTVVNDAVSYNCRHALHPACGGVIFSRIKLSGGALPKPADAKAMRTAPDCITVSWNPAVLSFSTCADDEATIVVFCPKSWTALVVVDRYLRRDGQAEISLSIIGDEEIVYTYIFFTSPKGVSSPTFYMKVDSQLQSKEDVIKLG